MRIGTIALVGTLCACGPAESTPAATQNGGTGNQQVSTGGSSQQPLGVGGSSGSSAQAECQLAERATGPQLALNGTACGHSVSFSTHAGQLIELSRTSLLHPLDEVSTITVKDDPSDFAPDLSDYFESFGLLFNVSLADTGPALGVEAGDYEVDKGLFVACGFGSLGFKPGMAHVAIESVDGEPTGQLRMTVSNLQVLGFDEAFGKTSVPPCEGSVSVTLEGAYSHDPG